MEVWVHGHGPVLAAEGGGCRDSDNLDSRSGVWSLHVALPWAAGDQSTHHHGTLVCAVASQDKCSLLRGDGHHRRVHQAQLHDACIEFPEAVRVV